MSGARRNRYAARVLVLDAENHLLMFRFTPDDRPPLWATAGGELEQGESFVDGARRELLEETGIDADPGVVIAERESDFNTFAGEPVHAVERYFAVRVADRKLDFGRHTETEISVMQHHEWRSIERLRAISKIEDVYPEELEELFLQLLR
jgi:8-oxo-dGTP diphosphatase